MKQRGVFVYYVSAWLVRQWARLWLRVEFLGQENIPREGPCIVACNHASFLDPPLVGIGVTDVRIVRFVARATLSSHRLVRWLYEGLLTIPLDRDKGDLKAMRVILDELERGVAVGLFPEGTRSRDGHLQPAKAGIGFLIAKSKAPVVPAYIDGSFQALPRGRLWIRPCKVRVFYGPPISPAEIEALGKGKEQYQKAGEWVMKKIGELGGKAG